MNFIFPSFSVMVFCVTDDEIFGFWRHSLYFMNLCIVSFTFISVNNTHSIVHLHIQKTVWCNSDTSCFQLHPK